MEIGLTLWKGIRETPSIKTSSGYSFVNKEHASLTLGALRDVKLFREIFSSTLFI